MNKKVKTVHIFSFVLLKITFVAMFMSTTVQAQVQAQARVENLTAEQVQGIVTKFSGRPFPDFHRFVFTVYLDGDHLFNREQHHALGEFVANRRLDPSERFIVHRLLGIYTRLKYGGDVRRMLGKLVSIPTVRDDAIEQHKNKNFIRFEKVISAAAKEFGLKYRNIGGRVYEVSLPGNGGQSIAIHAHADVVPVNRSQWVLENGTKLDPFKMTQVGNKLYGRGTQDDKIGIVVSMFAMRTIKEERLKVFNEFKLLIDTTEETTGSAIPYYLERNPTPKFNIALDGSYPVVIAEKGFGTVTASFPVRAPKGKGGEIVGLSGGLAINQIPSVSRATIASKSPRRLASIINDLGGDLVAETGSNFSVLARAQRGGVVVDVKGVSAHSSDPASGVNPIPRMLMLINQLRDYKLVKRNHITDAASYGVENWGLDYFGEKLGVGFEHEFMGPLTAAFTKVSLDDKVLELAVNLRIPKGKPLAQLQSEIETKLDAWVTAKGGSTEIEYRSKEPMYRDANGRWLNALLDISSENLGLAREFASSAGGTSIHFLPNGVQFGLSMPTEKYTGHNANEFKTIDQMLLDLQIVSETILRLGQMQGLE